MCESSNTNVVPRNTGLQILLTTVTEQIEHKHMYLSEFIASIQYNSCKRNLGFEWTSFEFE